MSLPEVVAPLPEVQESQLRSGQSIGLRLIKASGLVALGNISSRLIALLITIVTARALSEVEFGAFGVVQGTLGLFGITAGLSLGLVATRYVALYRISDAARARGIALVVLCIGIISSALTAFAMIAASSWLAQKSLNNPQLATPLKWAAVQLFLFSIYGIVSSILSGGERFGITSTANIFQNLAILIGSLALIPIFRVSGAIWAQCLGIAAALALGLYSIRDIFRGYSWKILRTHFRQEGRVVFDFCLPSVLAGLSIIPAGWLSLAMIARQPNGYTEVAYFTAADRFRFILLFVAGFVGTALLPILSSAQRGEGDNSESPRGLELGLISTVILVLPLGAMLAFGGPEIMSLFGRAYQINWAVLLPVIAWAGAAAISSLIGIALLAHGKQWFMFLQQATYGLCVLFITYLLRGFGGAGLALAHLITVLILIAWSTPVLQSLGVITQRALRTLFISTGVVCLLCLLAWLCPAPLRLVLAGPLILMTALFSFLFFPTRSERAQLRLLIMGVWTSRNSKQGSA